MKKAFVAAMILAACASALGQSTAFSGTLHVWPQLTHSKSNGMAVVSETVGQIIEQSIALGTNANQMTKWASKSGSLTNGQAVTFSLLGGISNSFGDALTFGRVNWLALASGSTYGQSLSLGGAASDPFVGWVTGTAPLAIVRANGIAAFFAPDATGYAVATNSHNVKIANLTTEPNALFAAGYLGIDAGIATTFRTTNAAAFAMNGEFWSAAATTNISFFAADTVNIETNSSARYGIWRIQAATNGTISTLAPATNQSYTSAALAIAALPAAAANNTALGYVVIYAPGSNSFTAGTTAMTTSNATFYDEAATSPASATYELYIGGN